ncbi:MAG: hypothetical protein KDA60_01185 [Planctomycetales bacterium]|nr:hypothetical protein [Planctomycetales bacterium]
MTPNLATLTTLALPLLCTVPVAAQQTPKPSHPYTNDEIGVTFQLPDESWKLNDRSQGPVKVLLFSPFADMRTRCVVMVFPKAVLPQGLETREVQVKNAIGEAYERLTMADGQFAGRPAKRWEYRSQKSKSIEWSIADGDYWFIFQLNALQADWEKPEDKAALVAIADSLAFRGIAMKGSAVAADRSTPQQVHDKRNESLAKPTRAFDLSQHDLEVKIDPAQKSLQVRDKLTVKALQPALKSIELYTSIVKAGEVTGPAELTWTSKPFGDPQGGTEQLTISFAKPLADGEQVELTVTTSSDDYFLALDQKLVAEIAVFGQVREKSSYSSHIVYYPIDQINDAATRIALTVPKGYTAVTGGELVEERDNGETTTFVYNNDHRSKRLLPFGFAAAKYVSAQGTSKSGLRLSVFGYPGEEELLQQRVAVAVESANLFEKMMGPLPWKDVRFAHVTPERKETGVSMPGFIVISDGFFGDISQVDLSDGNINSRDGLSLLVIADELSHQWNIYATPLPNELGEGISTFTNLLLVKERHGEEAFRRGVKFCQDAYMQSTAIASDVAIADPGVYKTTAYRGIVFCKTPVVLTMLHDLLGPEQFFAGWRKAFSDFETGTDGFEVMEKSFSETTGEDMRWFFDQWFFQAGRPKLKISHAQQDQQVKVAITQVQESSPYRLRGLLRVTGKEPDQTVEQMVDLSEAVHEFTIACPFAASSVTFDPDDRLLKEIVDPQ